MHIPFVKVQSVGNHFILIWADQVPDGADLSDLAERLCAHRFGVGADGLLVLSETGGLAMRMFNPDGTEDFCGNGLRCAAVVASQSGKHGRSFTIEHGGQSIACTIFDDGRVETEFAEAQFQSEHVPIRTVRNDLRNPVEVQGVSGFPVSTGSTHFVVFREQLLSDDKFEEVSAKIETDPVFPSGTSIMWAKPIAERRFAVQIWERGVGETFGCGTGAAAIAAVDALLKGEGGSYLIESKGGEIAVRLESHASRISSSTKPRIVFSGKASL